MFAEEDAGVAFAILPRDRWLEESSHFHVTLKLLHRLHGLIRALFGINQINLPICEALTTAYDNSICYDKCIDKRIDICINKRSVWLHVNDGPRNLPSSRPRDQPSSRPRDQPSKSYEVLRE
eukprot:scaffold11069_cov93-Skeletonema_marinoi.AAC.4